MAGCDVDSVTQLTIKQAQTSDYLIIFQVTNFILPDYVNSFFVEITSYKPDGAQLESSGSRSFGLTTLADDMTVTLATSSDVVGEDNDLTITVESAQPVKASGWIEIEMPKWNSGTQSMSLALPFFETNSLGMMSQGIYSIPCQSQQHASMICTFEVNQPGTQSEISQTFDTLKIQQFSSDFTELTVQTTSSIFKNPPSTKTISTFSGASYLLAGQLEAKVTQALKIDLKVRTPATLAPTNVELSVQDTSINVQTAYTFTVKTPLPMPVGLNIVIKVPKQLSLVSLNDNSVVVLTSAAGFKVAEIPYITILD
jgi:hypothetical protein